MKRSDYPEDHPPVFGDETPEPDPYPDGVEPDSKGDG